ncbi:MAG: alpha/beta hydrolase [Bacteroidales bacterium]
MFHRTISILKLPLVLVLLLAAGSSYAQNYKADILGPDFIQKTIVMPKDYEGRVVITVVKRKLISNTTHAILYIHGYNDYFFQKEAAEKFSEKGYRFYAVDLRKYGRSYLPNQYPFQVKSLYEYFADIDSALALIKQEGGKEIVLMGHSTGGLISSLYCHYHRQNLPIKALILNSPFLDMNLSPFLEKVGVPLCSGLGAIFPNAKLSMGMSTAYAESLLAKYHGEWSFDTTKKYPLAPKITLAWVRAIHKGQKKVQSGLNIPCPVLLLFSNQSTNLKKWTPEHQKRDAVLDVNDIAYYGKMLGKDVIPVEIPNGLHDLLLSSKETRNKVYQTIFHFLASLY